MERRFADALRKARADWVVADAGACAARAGCECAPAGVLVPLLGEPHLVTHPDGAVTAGGAGEARGGDRQAHAAVAVLLLHYLLSAGGAPPAGRWVSFRELPGGLFYAPAFASRAEVPLAATYAVAAGLPAFRDAAARLGGEPLDLADAAFSFRALPRVQMAVLVWLGDDELPGEARVLYDERAGEYLPAEDLAGLGGLLARRLTRL